MASKTSQLHHSITKKDLIFIKKEFGYGDVFTFQYLGSGGGY